MAINFKSGLTENVTLASGNGANRDFSADFTIFCWFTCTDKTADVQNRVLWGNGGVSSVADYMQLYISPTTGAMIFLTADTDRITGTTDCSDGKWRAAEITRVGTTITLYINGVAEGGTFTSATDYTHTAVNFFIGVYGATGTTGRWVGKATEFAIWSTSFNGVDRKNSNGKVKAMPLQIKPANIKVYLPMDDYPDGTSITGTVTNRTSKVDPGTPSGSPVATAEEVLTYQ